MYAGPDGPSGQTGAALDCHVHILLGQAPGVRRPSDRLAGLSEAITLHCARPTSGRMDPGSDSQCLALWTLSVATLSALGGRDDSLWTVPRLGLVFWGQARRMDDELTLGPYALRRHV